MHDLMAPWMATESRMESRPLPTSPVLTAEVGAGAALRLGVADNVAWGDQGSEGACAQDVNVLGR